MSTTTVTFRPETYSDLIGDVLLQCTANSAPPAGQSYITGDVKIYLNTNLANRTGVLGGPTITDGVLIVNENHATPTKDSTLGGPAPNMPVPQYGDLFLASGVQWSAVKIPIPGAKAPDGSIFPSRTTLRITNLRCNVFLLGITPLVPTLVELATVSVADAGKIPGASTVLALASVSKEYALNWSIPPVVPLPQCIGQNLSSSGKITGPPTFSVSVDEGYEAAFRPLGQPSTAQGVHAGEDGYPTPGLGTNGGGANQGTRIALSLSNVPAGVRLAVPSKVTSGSLQLQLVTTNENGAGAYNPVPGDGLVETDGQLVVYEVIASDNAVKESASIPITVAYASNSANNPPSLGIVAQLTVAYAPFFSSAAASRSSATLPQPRFSPPFMPRNAFVISRCVPLPVISQLFPTSVAAGSPFVFLQIGGTGFDSLSSVLFDGQTIRSEFTPPGLLSVIIPDTLLAKARVAQVQVVAADGQLSASVPFTITATAGPSTTPVDLGSVYNVSGAFSDGTAFPAIGGLDGIGYAYSANLLGRTLSWNGSNFALGPPNAPNAVAAKTVPLPAGQFGRLDILAAGVNGGQISQAFRVNYTDGTNSNFTQSLSDWFASSKYANEAVALNMPYRLISTGEKDNHSFNLYGYSFDLNSTKAVSSLVLPGNRNVVMLGAVLGPTITPSINSGGVVNNASATTPLASGSLVSIYGSDLTGGTAGAALPLPRQLLNTQVLVNGSPAPLLYVSPSQINFQMPFEAGNSGNAKIVVSHNGAETAAAQAALAEFAPGIYRAGAGAIVLHSDYSFVTATKPGKPAEDLVLYATGIGGLVNPPQTGVPASANPLSTARILPTVSVGARTATVQFAGLAPGFVGLVQINFRMPSTLPLGATQPLTVAFGNNSDTVTIDVSN